MQLMILGDLQETKYNLGHFSKRDLKKTNLRHKFTIYSMKVG